jgi:hypothetical protein
MDKKKQDLEAGKRKVCPCRNHVAVATAMVACCAPILLTRTECSSEPAIHLSRILKRRHIQCENPTQCGS